MEDGSQDSGKWKLPRFIRNFLIGLVVSTPIYLMNWYAYEPKEEPEPVVIDSQTAHKLQELINDADEEYRKSSRSEQNRPADTPALKKLHTFLGELRNDPSASPDAGLEPDKATEPQTGKDTNNKPLRNLLDNR